MNITTKVFNYFCVDPILVNSKSRKREIITPRQISMYFHKKYTKMSLSEIGIACGGKDHATVLHACKNVKNLYDTERDFREAIDELNEYFSKINKPDIPAINIQVRLSPKQYINGQYYYTLWNQPQLSTQRTVFISVKNVLQAIEMINPKEVDSLNIHLDYRQPELVKVEMIEAKL